MTAQTSLLEDGDPPVEPDRTDSAPEPERSVRCAFEREDLTVTVLEDGSIEIEQHHGPIRLDLPAARWLTLSSMPAAIVAAQPPGGS